MVVVLKIYSTGCTFFDANATSTTPTIQSTVRAIRLVNLSIKPDPDVLVEFTVGGFDASQREFGFFTPGYLWHATSITVVFKYPAPSGLKAGPQATYTVSLGQYDKHLVSHLDLTFKGDKEAYVDYYLNRRQHSRYDLVSRDMNGFHAIRYEVNNNDLQSHADSRYSSQKDPIEVSCWTKTGEEDNSQPFQNADSAVTVDGEALIPAGAITNVVDLTVFYTNKSLDYAPFVLFETHYTMDDVAAIIKIPAWYNKGTDFNFTHTNVSITVGGYALWNGTWTPGAKVTAVDSSTRIGSALEVPQSGKLVALLKFYRTGYSFADAGDSSKTPGLSKTFYSASLSSLYIRPNPLTLVEFRAVTGEINY